MSSVTLRYSEGSSDKVYVCRIIPQGDGFVVQFEYGRYGGSLKSDTKTKQPVSREAAEQVMAKLVREKKAKGYTESPDGKAYTGTELAGRDTGIRVQLLNPIEDILQLEAKLRDPEWGMQEKYNGERRVLVIEPGQVSGANRKGLSVPLSLEVVEVVSERLTITGRTEIDAEDFGTTVAPFDLLMLNGKDLRDRPYRVRRELLELLVSDAPQMPRLRTYFTYEEKRTALDRLRETGFEGVVFKRESSTYTAGRPASGGDALKFKFTESATCRVIGQNKDKRSVGLELMDTGTGLWSFVGNCTIPPNFAIPTTGQIVEIGYLYCTGKGGCLFQPTYSGVRRDQDASDCKLDQLKYKQEALHSQAA